MMEAVRTSETSVDNHFTRQYIPEDNSEHHTRRRENLKSHILMRSFAFDRNYRKVEYNGPEKPYIRLFIDCNKDVTLFRLERYIFILIPCIQERAETRSFIPTANVFFRTTHGTSRILHSVVIILHIPHKFLRPRCLVSGKYRNGNVSRGMALSLHIIKVG
jgi:hypothetical protein